MKLPVVSGKEAIRAFEKAGWYIERRAKSRHIIMKKSGNDKTKRRQAQIVQVTV